MTFINDAKEIIGEIVKQAKGTGAGFPAVEKTGVIFNSAAIAKFPHHFHVIVHSFADSLCFNVLLGKIKETRIGINKLTETMLNDLGIQKKMNCQFYLSNGTSLILLLKSICSSTSKSFNLRISSLNLLSGLLIIFVIEHMMGNIMTNNVKNAQVNFFL